MLNLLIGGIILKSIKLKATTICISIIMLSSSITVNAHPGRTDSSGGHRDNKNASGLGSYHYHCGGHEAHLHNNGCPYKTNNATTTTSKPNSTAAKPTNSKNNTSKNNVNKNEESRKASENKAQESKIAKEKESIKKTAFENGFNDGYAKKDDISSKYNKNYKEEYVSSYKEGFKKGENKINLEIENEKKCGFEDGSRGSKTEKNYENELLISSYNEGYEQGYKIYKEKMTEEFRLKGENDALNGNKPMEFDETNQEFKDIYISSYNSKKSEIDAEKENSASAFMGGVVILGAAGAGTVIYKKKKLKK